MMDAAQLDPLVAQYATKWGVRPSLLRAVIMHESGGDPSVTGDGGQAIGLMQMHPAAALSVGVEWAKLRGNPELQVDAGAHYLANQLARFQSDLWALAAYNQGPTVIGRGKTYAQSVLEIEAAAAPLGSG